MTAGPRRLRALVTNDDGIAASGLRHLAEAAMGAGLDVVVAAPIREFSGSSAAIAAVATGGHVAIERRTTADNGTIWYAINGSPALIALIATRGAFGPVPDLLLSGINRGANTGTAVMHSGTVGAALTAGVAGIRAMAVSLDLHDRGQISHVGGRGPRHWDTAATVVARFLPLLSELPPATVINLNVPDIAPDRLNGLRQATLGGFGRVQITEVEKDSGLVRISLEDATTDPVPGSDIDLLAQDYATVTALRPVGEADHQSALTEVMVAFDAAYQPRIEQAG